MGLNVSLIQLLGLPAKCECPKCKKTIPTGFDSYDIESERSNPRKGEWHLMQYCHECEHEWTLKIQVHTSEIEPKEENSLDLTFLGSRGIFIVNGNDSQNEHVVTVFSQWIAKLKKIPFASKIRLNLHQCEEKPIQVTLRP